MFSASEQDGPYQFAFVDDLVGWRISYDELAKTGDGGKTWVRQSTPFDGGAGQIRSIAFSDNLNGWIGGGSYRALSESEVRLGVPNNLKDPTGARVVEETIYRTRDGGSSWQIETLARRRIGLINRMAVSSRGGAVALSLRGIYRSDQLAGDWKPVTLDRTCTKAEYLNDNYEATPVSAFLSDFAVIGFSDGRLVFSSNGGGRFCDLLAPGAVDLGEARPYFDDLHFDDADHGWGLGGNLRLYETNDGGHNWKSDSDSIAAYSFSFIEGQGYLLSNSGVYRTGSKPQKTS